MSKFSKSRMESILRNIQIDWDEEKVFDIAVSLVGVVGLLYAWETVQSIVNPQRNLYTKSEYSDIATGRAVGDNVRVNGVDYSIDDFHPFCSDEPLFLSFQYDSDGLRRLIYLSNKD